MKVDSYFEQNPKIAETKGHSVTLTSYREYKSLENKQNDNTLKWEKLTDQVLKTANKVYSQPKSFINYYDYNDEFAKLGKTLTRVLREGYEFYAPETISAKAGYGAQEKHRLLTFTYFVDPTRTNLLQDYKTTMSSPDHIFDDGYAANANNEILDTDLDSSKENQDSNVPNSTITPVTKLTSDKVFELDADNAKLANYRLRNSNKNMDNLTVEDLEDQKSADTPIAKARMKWAAKFHLQVLPSMRLTSLNYRFAQKVLKNGKQAYATGTMNIPNVNTTGSPTNGTADGNQNVAGKVSDTNGFIAGGFRNYINPFQKDGNYILTYTSVPFGPGLLTTINYQTGNGGDKGGLVINGHRELSKNGTDQGSDSDEIIVQPALSGRTGAKIKGFTKKDNDFVKNNYNNDGAFTGKNSDFDGSTPHK